MPLFVTVTPGTTVTNSTTLDATTLNLLGTPSVDVTGTVDGGSLSLSAGSVGTTELASDAVTFAKMQNIDSDRLIGRDSAGSGDPEQITVGGGLQFTGSGGVEIAARGVTEAKLFEVTTKKLLGRNATTNGDVQQITVGSGLTLSDAGTLSVSGIYTKYSSPSGVAIPAVAGEVAGFDHHLGGYPSQFRVYAQCVNAGGSNGYSLHDRVPIEAFQGSFDVAAFVAWASPSQLGLGRTDQGNVYLNHKTTGSRNVINTDISSGYWQLYFEAVRFS